MNQHLVRSSGQALSTDIPACLDRLPWTRFHWLLVIALGVTWVLDGLEVTIVGVIGPMLEEPGALGLSPKQIGLSHTLYLAGAIGGALLFGHLTDRLGRKRLFTVTLVVYLDLQYLRVLGPGNHPLRGVVPSRLADGQLADTLVGGHVLLRLGGGECRISDGQRGVPR